MGPVCAQLNDLGVRHISVSTGQHSSLLRGSPAESDLSGSLSLGVVSHGNVMAYIAGARKALARVFKEHEPKIVVVQGDTMSAYAAAMEAADRGIAVAHVEAGVRSGDPEEPWPEERMRRGIDARAAFHFAPTQQAMTNLALEELAQRNAVLTGNTVVTALRRYSAAKPVAVPEDRVLVTLHRRELYQSKEFPRVALAIAGAAKDRPGIEFVWPLHPATVKTLPKIPWRCDNLKFWEPLAYRTFTELLASSRGVLTDSGGVVEEATTLGVPTAILRNVNDRPEAVDVGVARLYGARAGVVRHAVDDILLGRMKREPSDVFGTVAAATNVATRLLEAVK